MKFIYRTWILVARKLRRRTTWFFSKVHERKLSWRMSLQEYYQNMSVRPAVSSKLPRFPALQVSNACNVHFAAIYALQLHRVHFLSSRMWRKVLKLSKKVYFILVFSREMLNTENITSRFTEHWQNTVVRKARMESISQLFKFSFPRWL